MEITLNAAQVELRERFALLIDEELTPSIRRMGERPRDDDLAEVQELRRSVWGALTDLGATRLLLATTHGGAAAGQQGAVVLAEMLGEALYQGPLLDTMTAAEILDSPDTDAKIVGRIADGAPVALAFRETGTATPGKITLHGEQVSARRRFVGYAADAEYLCVVGDGPKCAVVARDHPSVTMRRQEDTGRGELYDVTLEQAPVLTSPTDFAQRWQRILAGARLRQAAYLVGLSHGALSLAVRRVSERRQFGQPIGRFQAPAFTLAAAATRVEGARWLVRATAWEADEGLDIRLRAAQSLAMAADLSRTVLSAAMQAHGAYGITEQADIQIYYRRAAIERAWFGSPQSLRAEVAPLLLALRQQARFT